VAATPRRYVKSAHFRFIPLSLLFSILFFLKLLFPVHFFYFGAFICMSSFFVCVYSCFDDSFIFLLMVVLVCVCLAGGVAFPEPPGAHLKAFSFCNCYAILSVLFFLFALTRRCPVAESS
jgi:hypothetical protein